MSKDNPEFGDVFTINGTGDWYVLLQRVPPTFNIQGLTEESTTNGHLISSVEALFSVGMWQYQFNIKELLLGVNNDSRES